MVFLILFVVSIVFNIIGVILISRALKRQIVYDTNESTYKQFIDDMSNRVSDCIELMRRIDIRGSFESDDEVGGVFQELKLIVSSLQEFEAPFSLNGELDAQR